MPPSMQSPPRLCGLILSALLSVTACGPGPGAGIHRPGYPSLTQSTRSYNWLVVKCQLSDAPNIPAGLDTKIQQFFGISGTGYGNVVDYYHDVSYNHASVLSDTTVGWIKAPFSTANLQTGPLAPSGARVQRVQQCLSAIPAAQLPDLDQFYGVVVINNVVQDGGSCFPIGPIPIVVANKSYKLACVWFDPNSLFTAFAAHEIGHGLGLTHSYDDTQRYCGGAPGEYCDPWDIMSALATFNFPDPNWSSPGQPGGGPGLSAPSLISMDWLSADNKAFYKAEQGGEQTFTIQALSHARAGQPLVVIVPLPSLQGASQYVSVEYRQIDGWDAGFNNSRAKGGAVLVHRGNSSPAGPLSMLIENPAGGELQPCGKLVFGLDNGFVFHVSAESFNLANGSATVSMGFGSKGKFLSCPGTTVTSPGGVIFSTP
jgi:hypothetical protein